jgi:hypothetical protein
MKHPLIVWGERVVNATAILVGVVGSCLGWLMRDSQGSVEMLAALLLGVGLLVVGCCLAGAYVAVGKNIEVGTDAIQMVGSRGMKFEVSVNDSEGGELKMQFTEANAAHTCVEEKKGVEA